MRKRWGKAISYLLNPRDEHLQALEMALRCNLSQSLEEAAANVSYRYLFPHREQLD